MEELLLHCSIIAACLKFAEEHLGNPQHTWKRFCGLMKQNMNCSWRMRSTKCMVLKGHSIKNIPLTLKHDGGSIMICACFASKSSKVYQNIPQGRVVVAAQQLKLSRS